MTICGRSVDRAFDEQTLGLAMKAFAVANLSGPPQHPVTYLAGFPPDNSRLPRSVPRMGASCFALWHGASFFFGC